MNTQTQETAPREQLDRVLTMLENFEKWEVVQRGLRDLC